MSELEGPVAWLSGLDWSFPTAPGVLHGLCYTVIALHSVYKQILSLFLMGVKKKNRERGKKNNLWKWCALSLSSLKRFK